MNLSEFIGQEIGMLIPRIHQVKIQRIKLLGVEFGGVWIESQALTNDILRALGVPASPKTLVFFLPYHEITFAMVGVPGVALDEKSFGV